MNELTDEDSMLEKAVLAKNKILVVMLVYGAKTRGGNVIIVCKLHSLSNLALIDFLILSVPNKKPSGRITAALPSRFSLNMITDMNKSAVSELLKSTGKLF